MDKGLRLYPPEFKWKIGKVSILGLVDKGLRHRYSKVIDYDDESFNPWFSG